ncbi:MAG: capsular biosynthesis protein [Sphingomonas sp.]|nr:capsular biosynthesis protein [Sphingomonas sp.]
MPDAGEERDNRAFVFLQGPPGPLLHQLALSMRSRGVVVERINICAGDRIDWPEPATNFRGSFRSWPVFFDNFLREHEITDILLFGDCRPYHVTARRLAELRGIRVHVLEEGYLRPHWMTLELGGVNGYSPLNRCSKWFVDHAKRIRPEGFLPPVTASFRRRVRDTARHYIAVHAGAFAYPHYKTHRADPPLIEAAGWIWKSIRSSARARSAKAGMERLGKAPFFLLPLQLSGDYQIRNHSPFPDMPAATSFVLESFAAHADDEVHLLIKAHPLESSFFPWGRFIAKRARQLGIGERVHFIDGGDLNELAGKARGMVCVNSTSATLALAAGTPVCTLGDAIYNVPGLTFGGHLDEFWIDPPEPAEGLYQAFRKVLVDRCLVRGGLASESAVNTLVESMTERLCARVVDQTVESSASAFAK